MKHLLQKELKRPKKIIGKLKSGNIRILFYNGDEMLVAKLIEADDSIKMRKSTNRIR